jgi:hypothetical protein
MNKINNQDKIQTHSFPKGRIFIFIDETGDPSHYSNSSSSQYFQFNFTIIHRESLHKLNKHMASFRYFKDSGKEFKRYIRDEKILAGLCADLVYKENVLFLSFILDKKEYIDTYLNGIKKDKDKFDTNKFRNYVIKQCFEYIFNNLINIETQINNIEVIFDRYLESEEDENSLKKYLRGNNKLPKLDKIVQIDSEYSDSIQVSDFIGKLVKEYCLDLDPVLEVNIFEFIQVFDLKNLYTVIKKCPTLEGMSTRHFSSMTI